MSLEVPRFRYSLSDLTFFPIVTSSFQNGIQWHTCREVASTSVSGTEYGCFTHQIHSNAFAPHLQKHAVQPEDWEAFDAEQLQLSE
jgi:hypothetical protein